MKCNGWHRSFGAIESGSIPTHPTGEMVVEGWSPYPSDKRIALSSILRATTDKPTTKDYTMQSLIRLKRIAMTSYGVVV